jgi:hypothetical protein
MRFPEKLKELLKELEQYHQLKGMNVDVEPSGGGRFVAVVTSLSFADIPEEARQDLVWGKVMEKLNDYEQRLVEFIDTPSPLEERSSGEPLPRPRKPAKRR